jgi:serine/threonine protein kinase
MIPKSVEILGSSCFLFCNLLSSVTFEANSRLIRIESFAFTNSLLRSIVIPSTILFLAFDAVNDDQRISLLDGDSCAEFDRWLKLRTSRIVMDFRRIVRVSSGLQQLRDYVVNLSGFEEGSMIGRSDVNLKEIYQREEDEFLIIVKSISQSEWVEQSHIEKEIENLINVRHPCIVAPIGFVFGSESEMLRDLKIVGLYPEGSSLSEVISINPGWWTATAKAKAVVGIVLGLRFLHSLGLLHNGLKSNNIHFDADHCIQLTYFGSIGQKVSESSMGGFSGSEWTCQTDVHGFALILFKIVVGRSVKSERFVPPEIPEFVSNIIEEGLWSELEIRRSFYDIFKILKANSFRIVKGVDSAEVLAFANWVGSAENPDK